MDARPFRPRGAENAKPALHQRHKSTGTLNAGPSAASTAGFRGIAKRAAFGDVTNVGKHHGIGRDDHKVVKVRSVAHLDHNVTTLGNKENMGIYKDGLARPAQRPAALANKTKVPSEIRVLDSKKPAVKAGSSEAVNLASNTESGVVLEEQIGQAPKELIPQNASIDLHPRHFKSQPQLEEQQQPNVRINQSRQLESTEIAYDQIVVANGSSNLAPLPENEPLHDEYEYVDSLEVQNDREVQVNMHPYERCMELPSSRLPHASEDNVIDVIPSKDGPTPGPSEPEEYWDEDDEYYDDQDQAFTTAHSFRSRDMTTGGATTVLQPRVTARVERELEEARLEVERVTTEEEIEEELWDVSMVAEYGDEIFSYMRELEIKMLPNPHYMDAQTEIQWSMRSVLMDWLVQVHSRFCLLPETLFLTVNYIDRFLTAKVVSIGKLQLVGATAILLAAKYEEINCPSLEEIVYMVDKGYSGEEILKAERFMLSMLGFELGWPGPMSFLRRVSKADDYDLETRTLAKYFLELTIMDERFVASPPSFLAAGAHCLSRLILNKGPWTRAHVHYSGYTWSQLRSLVSMMIGCCDHPRLHHAAIFEKYSDRKFKEAALIVQDCLEAGWGLPQQNVPVRGPYMQPYPYEDASEHVQYRSSAVAIEG